MKKFVITLLLLLCCAASALADILPATGVDEDFKAWTGLECTPAVVLCESLSILDNRGDQGGKKVGTLLYGNTPPVIESWDGYAKIYYADGSKTGWVRNDYLLMDPAWYLCDEDMQVYAYPDTMSPRVALLDKGTKLPIITEYNDDTINGWVCVSLRGAAGWIRKTPKDTADDTWFRPEMLSDITGAVLEERPVEEGEEELVESLLDVDGDIVDAILHGATSEIVEEVGHLPAVFVGEVGGLETELAMGFEVDEKVGTGFEVEIDFVGEVVGVEEDDLVLVVAQVAQGVEKGFSKTLEVNGVGYRAEKKGNQLVMRLGFSHEVIVEEIPGITIEVNGNKITIRGIDKQVVGQFAAEVRGKRPPEPYKGKGIKYVDEVIRRKVGKTGGKK